MTSRTQPLRLGSFWSVGPNVVAASGVRRLGGQCLQVLLSAQATWAADGHAFDVVEPSPEFTESLALMGAADLCPPETATLS